MQERYNVRRDERLSTVVEVVAATQGAPRRIIDLGVGTGTLALRLLEAFDDAQVIGIDLDPSMLALARERLAGFGDRFQLIEADLRQDHWVELVGGEADAVVSATALHWLSPSDLSDLYGHVARALVGGGAFLNADHVASRCAQVGELWERQRREAFARGDADHADDWDGFWRAFGEAAGIDLAAYREQILGEWEGVEEGLPLEWHFERLRAVGIGEVDCFWRFGGDAVYGGALR